MDKLAEWTFEGDLNDSFQVGLTGNRTRYQFGMYELYMNKVDILSI